MKVWRKKGFHYGWLKEAVKLCLFVRKNNRYEYNSIEIIGLSAGGAIGAIVAFIFDKSPVHVTTVNAPKFCNRKRLKEIEKYMTALVHRGDMVTYLPPFYAAPKRKYYGDKTWFWTAHNETPEEWKEF
jgi:esterase/lipase